MVTKKDLTTGISYKIIGNERSNETLLFIHGAGGNKMALFDLASQFGDYRCVLIDLPGHSLSDGNTPETVAGYAATVEKFLESCKSDLGDSITCVGHSMGGLISLELAIRKVPAIKRLVILNSGAKLSLDTNFMKKVNKGKIDKLYLFKAGGSYFNPRTYRFFFKSFKQMITSEKVMCEDMKIVARFDRREVVKEITLPTFIATGEKEILATVQFSEYLHSQIQGSELLILKGLSHLMPVIAPEKLAESISQYFNLSEKSLTKVKVS